MNEPRLLVISAPSGCGKGTVLGAVFKDIDVFYSVSCTTRPPRPGEINGTHYHFLAIEDFDRMVEEDGFLEHAGFVDKQYGTPAAPVLENFAAGKDVILEIETNGAFQVREKRPDAALIFILPPSVAELRRRLYKRGTETPEEIEKRVSRAADEIAKSYDYDYVFMNDDLDDAIRDFKTIYNAVKNGDDSADRFRTYKEETINMINEVLKNA
ncbi:MAG: guanylate kinase [Ruminococcus sp.]|nr:guanylate kinase [Ruminococcus sp.]